MAYLFSLILAYIAGSFLTSAPRPPIFSSSLIGDRQDGSRLQVFAEGIFFPLSFVILLVIENVTDEELVAHVVNHGDHPVLVAANIKNQLAADGIGRAVGLPDVSKTGPVARLHGLIPRFQRGFSVGMLGAI